jgi:lipopolysaccharide biosynthesis regulator YciM
MFYKSECNILNNEFDSALSILSNLLEDKNLPSQIYEKTLVRLGQVYCVTDSKAKAEEMFAKLKKEFPNSIYLKLADCSVVE